MIRIGVFAVLVVACGTLFGGAVQAGESAGQALDDTTMATKVKAGLVDNKQVAAGTINVEVYKGIVQLSGFVGSGAEKSAALSVAKANGARKVLDAMVVMPGKRSAGEVVDDTTLQTEVKAKLVSAEGLGKGISINTWVHRGEVLLAGFVRDSKTKSEAARVAGGVKGVKKVINNIAVEP